MLLSANVTSECTETVNLSCFIALPAENRGLAVQYVDEKRFYSHKIHSTLFPMIRRFPGKVKDYTLLGLLNHEDKCNETIRHGETSQTA